MRREFVCTETCCQRKRTEPKGWEKLRFMLGITSMYVPTVSMYIDVDTYIVKDAHQLGYKVQVRFSKQHVPVHFHVRFHFAVDRMP